MTRGEVPNETVVLARSLGIGEDRACELMNAVFDEVMDGMKGPEAAVDIYDRLKGAPPSEAYFAGLMVRSYLTGSAIERINQGEADLVDIATGARDERITGGAS